jgi:hypothetical protein
MKHSTLTISQISLLAILSITGLVRRMNAQEPTPVWKVESPYPTNPLKEALLSGKASHGDLSTKAEMQLECRPDSEGPRVNLISVLSQVKFNSDPFEGPGGLGERTKLRLTLANTTWFHNFSGYYVDDKSFVLSFALSDAEARGIASASAKSVMITVNSAKKGEPLAFQFELPAPSAAVRSMIVPCLNKR